MSAEDPEVPGPSHEEQKALAQPDEGRAADELKYLSSGTASAELKAAADAQDHKRSQRLLDTLSTVLNLSVVGLFFFGALFVCAWAFNIVLPEDMRWLSADSIDRIQNMLTGSVLASAVAGYLQRQLK